MNVDRPTAIVREVADSYSLCLVREAPSAPIDVALARSQHAAYVRALSDNGFRVIVLPADDRFPDCCFIEDTAVVLDDLALITRPGAASRRREVDAVADALSGMREIVRLQSPATLDGGDVLRVGRELFVGSSGRTNPEGIAQLTRHGSNRGFRVTPVQVINTLHLKSAVTAIDDQTVLLARGFVDEEPLQHLRRLEVPTGEFAGANVVRLPGASRLLIQEAAAATRSLLMEVGFTVISTDISEFSKGDAGLTCLSLILAGPQGPGDAL